MKCLFGFHGFYVMREYSRDCRRIGCRRCRLEWGMKDGIKVIVPWCKELAELHDDSWPMGFVA